MQLPFESLGTGPHICSTTFHSEMLQTLPDELHKLLPELIQCVIRERKGLSTVQRECVKPHPSSSNGVILTKLAVTLGEITKGSG